MDESLIKEVEKHAIIYNRQKKTLATLKEECLGKEFAWVNIASQLNTDVDTCKKRWKYLRERYVQQKKQGETQSFEHLSRPYLEKMRFLDKFIQSRKTYRGLNHYINSHVNVDLPESSKCSSNGSSNKIPINFPILNEFNMIKTDAIKKENDIQNVNENRQDDISLETNPVRSLSSSSLMSPPPINHQLNNINNSNNNQRNVPKTLSSNDELDTNTNSDDEERLNYYNGHQMPAHYQTTHLNHQYNSQRPVRTSDELLGELVTTELIKMPMERKKIVQKRILEILFFED